MAEVEQVNENQYQTIEGLQTHPRFKLLTTNQQKFLLAYIKFDGDREKAAKEVSDSRNPARAADKWMNSIKVRELLAIYYGYEADTLPMTRAELKGLIAARIRQPETEARDFVNLVKQYLELTSSKKPKATGRPTIEEMEENAEESKVDIDALVAAIEKQKKSGN